MPSNTALRFPEEEGHVARSRTEVQLWPSLHFTQDTVWEVKVWEQLLSVSSGEAGWGSRRWKIHRCERWRRGFWGHCTEGEVGRGLL